MLRRILLLAVPAIALFAADKPDYSGHWVLDAAKSDFGPIPAPTKMERDIDHKDPQMKIKSFQQSERGELKGDMAYTTDGKEATVNVRGRDAKVVAKWEGSKLEVTTKSEFNGMALTQKESWTLSGDGKTLTINNDIQSPQGEITIRSVFTKGS